MAVLVGLMLACSHADPPPPRSGQPRMSAGEWLACRKLAPLVKDISDGIVSNDEYRSKLKEVYEQANDGTETPIAVASRKILKTATTGGTQQEIVEAFREAGVACANWSDRAPY